MKIMEEQKALLSLIANSLFGVKAEIPCNTDFNRLLTESKQQAVTALALKNVSMPENVKDTNTVFKNITVNSRVFADHTLLNNIMTKANIPYTVLKGAASAYYYPDPIFRAMGDVDFLVKKEDIEKATEVLKQNGFKPWEEEHICHIVFRKGKIHLEMHFEPAGVPNGKAGEAVRKYISDMIETSSLVKSDICTFVNPDKFHHGLIMLLHMQHHLLSEGIGLRHLCDWAVFVNSFKGNEFETLFKERLKNVGLWTFAKTISLAASIGIGLPKQEFMGGNTELACSTLNDIISGGNFGSKDKDRSGEGFFISNRGKDGVNHSRPVQFILSVNQIVYTNWKVTKKAKILLPIGWAFWGIRRFIRVLTGKRRHMNFKKLYNSSKSRKELYKQLHLFETEC